ncbi:MerR family transcriptional regulator [Actinokineospora auranticolor]|uniref:MerR-like DNA binding protein n=1 Tax=Actinokineospora auranticolor TaxID=155976 RepID=A0A2S6GIM8_9PSEU|nr:MerR family transcriptional regulator [Actinokineospora auranticolor]PPK65065.1 MerR-like DNA binding protein [Actinokineospora auranticolor]
MTAENNEPDFSFDGLRDFTWTAGEVARRLGVTESTLRSWHHRYGMEPCSAREGGQRRYGTEDVVRMSRMRELVESGMRPSAAAALLQRALPLRDAHQAVVAAGKQLDTGACADLLTQVIRSWGVTRTWNRVCRPALRSVEQAQRADPDCVDHEHALSWSVTAALHRVHRPAGEASILLACGPGEQHSLPVEALAAALAEHGVPARVLGAATPTPALVRAVTTTTPRAVLLWSHHPDPAHHAAASALADLPPRLLVAGPGWRHPIPWEQPTSLVDAVSLLSEH